MHSIASTNLTIKIKMKKQIRTLLSMAIALVLTATAKSQTVVNLRAGTPVQMETSQELTSKNLTPQSQIDLRVRYDVKVGDKVVIQAGTPAKANVTMVKRAKGCGKAGILEIKAVTVTTVDGQKVNLFSNPIKEEGENKKGLAWGLSVGGCFFVSPLSFFFLLIKGKEAVIPAGLAIDGQIANAVTVTIE